MISTKEVDYLEQDDPIRGQNFVCVSFISPEDVIKQKEAFFFEKYTKAYVQKNKEFIETLKTLFPEKKDEIRIMTDNFDFLFDETKVSESFKYYCQDQSDNLEKEYYEKNEFQTSIRGLKVRGVFDTIQEAQHKSENLRKKESNKFSIYIAQVGCWCPWSPNPDSIECQEFAETELNTMMKKYKENIDDKTIFFENRKEELKHSIKESEEMKKKVNEDQELEELEELEGLEVLEGEDPWISKMKEKNLKDV